MGTITLPYTFIAGQTPTATNWNANPTTIATLVNGQIDKANVDSSSSDGIVTMDETQSISGAKTFSGAVINTGGVTIKDTDNAAGSIQTNLTLEWDPGDGEQMTDNSSGVGIDFKMPDASDNQTVFASLDVLCLDDSASSEDGEFSFKTVVNASEAEVLTLSGAAATFTVPIDLADNVQIQFGDADDASIKWDATNLAIAAGSADVKITASNVIPATNDGSALGVSGTAWSDLFLASGSVVDFHAGDVTLTHSANTLTVAGGTLATAALTAAGTVTVGVDDTGYDVQFFGAAAGAFSLWDEDQNRLEIRGATAAGAGTLRLSTGELTVVDGDKLGQIDFVAPVEESGTDAILVGASIYAEADDTFAADNNSTDLIFATGASAAAAERMRIESDGKVSIGVVAGDGKLNVHTASAGSVSAHANGDEVVIEGSGSTGMSFLSPADQSQYIYFGDPGNNRAGAIQYYHGNDGMYFYTDGLTTRMVLDGNGNMGVGGTPTSTQRVRLESAHASTQVATCVHTSATSPRGVYCQFTGAAPDDNSAFFFQGEDTGAIRINIWSDGDLANHDGTYGTISDVKFKEDIVDARSYWDDFKSLRYRKWRDKSDKAVQGDDAPYRLGLVAQEVESIFPLLVPVAAENESYEVDVPAEYDDEGNETKPAGKKTERRQSETETFKWVKSSIIEGPILAKVVQELQARVEALEAA